VRIEAVICCVEYSDLLAAGLPHNLPHFDDLVVVTAPGDSHTRRLCKQWSIRYLETNVWWRDGSRFNKALGINHGLNHLTRSDWLLHLDADIVLPPRFRHMLANAELDKGSIHGADRVNCPSWEAWQDFLARPEIQYEWQYLVKPPRGWPLGARIAHGDYGGYAIPGFLQLWNVHSGITRYPTVPKGSAESSDILHSFQWDRPRRVLLPEVIAVHLESGRAKMGANWHGRTTPAFGPPGTPIPLMTGRRYTPNGSIYDGREEAVKA
jgi:hypothetical protein